MRTFGSIFGEYGNRHDPRMARAMTDFVWYGSVRLGFVLLACAILYGAWALWDAASPADISPGASAPTSSQSIDQQGLSKEVSALAARASAYQALIHAPSTVADPRK